MKEIFVVDDQREVTDLLVRVLKDEGYNTKGFYNADEALKKLKNSKTDLVLLDIQMPEMDGIEAFDIIKKIQPDIKIIVMTAYADKEQLIHFIEKGAIDFISKPFKLKDIKQVIKDILSTQGERENNIYNYCDIIGESDKIRECIDYALKLSNSNAPILITGESGTGKEVIVDFIHYNSIRKRNKIIKINCAAIPSQLLESELFGYEKGAFSDAKTSKPGKLEEANGGTLFLDEICEMDVKLQTKLLRVLEYKEFERLGSNDTIKCNFRIICATNREIDKEIKEERFRKDLYYRINTFNLKLPRLEERKEDIPKLVDYFIKEFQKEYVTTVSRVSDKAMDALMSYDWPGNIRELKNVIERIASITRNNEIEVDELPGYILEFSNSRKDLNVFAKSIEDVEKEHIINILSYADHKKEASEILGISEKTLYNKLKKYNI